MIANLHHLVSDLQLQFSSLLQRCQYDNERVDEIQQHWKNEFKQITNSIRTLEDEGYERDIKQNAIDENVNRKNEEYFSILKQQLNEFQLRLRQQISIQDSDHFTLETQTAEIQEIQRKLQQLEIAINKQRDAQIAVKIQHHDHAINEIKQYLEEVVSAHNRRDLGDCL